ncbi:MAG TPA: cysteine dioxygenase family protein [Thermoanaerobaculia bacterium]|nr:cysteine dioxygenase family protein [Thermoanaerobaculia bacterium]
MTVLRATDVEDLVERLREAAGLSDIAATTERIKETLEELIPPEGLVMPERFLQVRPDSYARRLLYQDPEHVFTALIMTWGPGQRTALHDHAGIWCVEGVVQGQMEVCRYEMAEECGNDLFRFADKGCVRAVAGSAGALIPPFEHHVLANALTDRPSLTLHVYGGEMDHCSIFEPQGDGFYRRIERSLSYDD